MTMDARRMLPTDIKSSIIAPMLVVAGVAFCATLIVGTNIHLAARNEAASIESASEIALHAKATAEGLAEAEAYVEEVMAMTRMIPGEEVNREFSARLSSLGNDLRGLQELGSGAQLVPIEELANALQDWASDAEVVLGLKASSAVPTLDQLEFKVSRISELASQVVADSRHASRVAVDTANATISRNIQLGALVIGGLFVLALVFGWFMSRRISKAMTDVSGTLRRLSDLEAQTDRAGTSEIADMFASLAILEDSIAEKARMSEQLLDEMHRAEEAANTKSRFLANMSHEIRTPINGVLGMAEILNGTELNSEQRECAQTILSSSEALLTVINDILDFSKNEAGELQLAVEPFSLYDVVFDVAGLLGPSIGGSEVEISIDYLDSFPKHFVGDAGRMRQILMNTVGNGIKFTPQGSVALRVDHIPQDSLPLKISIKDTGVGIPEDKIDHIFDAFHQAEMQASRRFQGTGLGLAITKQLVEQMGGRISVTSKVNHGSEFLIELPLKDVVDAILPSQNPIIDTASLRGKHVLIVDDLALNRAILSKTFSSWGMETVSCSGADDIGKMTDEELADIDIALLDYNMPGMCGDALFVSLKERLGVNCFPTILYSSGDQAADLPRMKEIGFSALLTKPARAQTLAKCFLSALQLEQVDGPAPTQQKEVSFDGLNILVAEDSKTNRLVLRKMLQSTGANLVFCENGAEAVRTYSRDGADLIFMDMSMPIMDGTTATQEIRIFEEMSGTTRCPIIALTANAMAGDKEACLAAGMSDFLTKPVRKAEVLERISVWHDTEHHSTPKEA